MKISVLTWNTLFAGRDGTDDRRARLQIELINERRPDIFLMQEAKGFEANGNSWLYAMEHSIGMRGFLAQAPRTGQNTAIFIREPLRPLSFDSDSHNFHHALAILKVAHPDIDRPMTLICAHLSPSGVQIRLREAAHLGLLAAPNALSLITGDFNSASPHDPVPSDWTTLAVHHRARYVSSDQKSLDGSVLTHLEAAGWVDIGHALGSSEHTVPGAAFQGTEFATMRCDFVLASKALSVGAHQYEVIRTPATDAASDHYPVAVSFEIGV